VNPLAAAKAEASRKKQEAIDARIAALAAKAASKPAKK
jgi:hypothetical protein